MSPYDLDHLQNFSRRLLVNNSTGVIVPNRGCQDVGHRPACSTVPKPSNSAVATSWSVT